MINTFSLIIFLEHAKGTGIEYHNISRVAVKRFLDYWKEHKDFLGYEVSDGLFIVNEES